ncbi:MAG: hypothetical protein IKE33_02905 [Erysipelotrichaceae bacterium]|nr:hypothetical protein [Erysipelotrichaceae bacterium]
MKNKSIIITLVFVLLILCGCTATKSEASNILVFDNRLDEAMLDEDLKDIYQLIDEEFSVKLAEKASAENLLLINENSPRILEICKQYPDQPFLFLGSNGVALNNSKYIDLELYKTAFVFGLCAGYFTEDSGKRAVALIKDSDSDPLFEAAYQQGLWLASPQCSIYSLTVSSATIDQAIDKLLDQDVMVIVNDTRISDSHISEKISERSGDKPTCYLQSIDPDESNQDLLLNSITIDYQAIIKEIVSSFKEKRATDKTLFGYNDQTNILYYSPLISEEEKEAIAGYLNDIERKVIILKQDVTLPDQDDRVLSLSR